MIETKHYQSGSGSLEMQMLVTRTGSGIIIQLLGGDKPHVGATVIAHPRPSLADPDKISCSVTVIPELGHKEDELAKPLAERVAVTMNQTVVLVAGIHVENASDREIKQISDTCRELVEKFLTNS